MYPYAETTQGHKDSLDPDAFFLQDHITGVRLAVVAVKVVHPGESGQAVGCDTHRHDRRIARMNIHKNARLTPPEPALAKAGVDSCWCSGLRVAAGGSP